MSTSLDDIWSEPVEDIPNTRSRAAEDETHESSQPRKRPRTSLFLAGSDDEAPATAPQSPLSNRPDIDNLFENLDEDPYVDQSFDIDAFRRDARQRAEGEGSVSLTPRAIQSSSPPPDGLDKSGKKDRAESDKNGNERKPLPKLDEVRLLDKHGFPALIQQSKAFKPRGKGHEVGLRCCLSCSDEITIEA